MNRFLSGVIAASFVATVGLSAQQNPPGGAGAQQPGSPGGQQPGATTSQQKPSPSAQAGAGQTVTISGCIESAPAATAKAGEAGASATAGSKFVLADAKMAGGAAGGAVGTTGGSMRYTLEGEEKAISPHLNHQVEITGMLDKAGAPSAAGGAASATAPPTLKVQSVKMVSATCTK
jgi:hypothetical protein